MDNSDFVHLHVHSEYSFLDGIGKIESLVKQAVANGQEALAITDHGAMHGVLEHYRMCKKYGIKPIIGIEAYLTPWGVSMNPNGENGKDRTRHHMLLLAQNDIGYKNLLKIASASQLDGFYYKPRIDHDFLAAHSDGLIATSGCLGSEINFNLNDERHNPKVDYAFERLQWYLDVFGRNRFFIEFQEHGIETLTKVNKHLFRWMKEENLQGVITNDCHYPEEKDWIPHDALLCIQTKAHISDKERMRMQKAQFHMAGLDQMKSWFSQYADVPNSLFTNTRMIADMCEVSLEDDKYHLPDLPAGKIPDGYNYETFLRFLSEKGIREKYGDRSETSEIQGRMDNELSIIHKMGFDVYFLIVWDLCQYSIQNNIWWNVRGSGAGSIVAYALGITLIDPIKNNLIFERFLHEGRNEMPDFDLDYPDDQREQMIRYTIDTYGKENVAQIATFGKMKARAAIRDVGRVQGIDYSYVDQMSKWIDPTPSKNATISKTMDEESDIYSPEFVREYENNPQAKELVDISLKLEGTVRQPGTHAAAVIVADKPLVNYVPLMRPVGKAISDRVIQFDYPTCESIGLLKVDFLGLSTLTVLRRTAELIQKRHGVEYNLSNIPLEDEKAFEILGNGDCTGLFQVDGSGMRKFLKQMKPTKFENIVAMLALYRPGPIQYIPNYIKRMHGEEKVEYRHTALEPILGFTYGIIVFQESIMRIATDLCGYTGQEADYMRSAVSKKKEKEIAKHRQLMIDGAVKNGISEKDMGLIYDDIEKFASYGFNQAHASDYAMVTCATAFMKAHYPVEFMTALLSVEHKNQDKIGLLMNECRRLGIKVSAPSINKSQAEFVVVDGV